MTEEDKNLLANFRTLGAENKRLREALEFIRDNSSETLANNIACKALTELADVHKSEGLDNG